VNSFNDIHDVNKFTNNATFRRQEEIVWTHWRIF